MMMDDGWMDKMLGGSMIDPILYVANGRDGGDKIWESQIEITKL
jgi:hypothetical protein